MGRQESTGALQNYKMGHEYGSRRKSVQWGTTWEVLEKPSISESSWLSVWSRSSLPWAPPLIRPTASISSTKMIAGASDRACGTQRAA